MGVATSLSRLAGLVREQAFAYLFGAGAETDAFNVAFRIPNLLRDLFAEGAMSSAFVPTFNRVLTREGRDRAFALTNQTLSAILVVVGTCTVVGIGISPWLVELLAGSFQQVPGKFEVTVQMTRIMFPYLLVISWAAIFMGMLNSLGRFFVPAIAPATLNLAMIVAGFTLCPLAVVWGAPAIVGMAAGAMLGGVLQALVQLAALWRQGFRPAWRFTLSDPDLRQIGRLMIPGTVGLAATQVNVAVSTVLATGLGTGPVSWLGYAFRLMQLPIGIFGVAVAQANLPVVSRQAAAGDRRGFVTTIGGSLRLTCLLTIPAAIGLAVLAQPIIRLLFEHGRFTAADTAATAEALIAYAVGLFAFSAVKVLGPSFYALGDTRTPVTASLLAVATSLTASILLSQWYGASGLALATGLGGMANVGWLWWRLRARMRAWAVDDPGLPSLGLAGAVFASIVAGMGGAGVAAAVHRGGEALGGAWLAGFSPRVIAVVGNGAALLVAAVVALPVVLWLARLLGVAEVAAAVGMIRRRLGMGAGGAARP